MNDIKIPQDPEPFMFEENFRTSNYIPRWLTNIKKMGFIGEALYNVILFFGY